MLVVFNFVISCTRWVPATDGQLLCEIHDTNHTHTNRADTTVLLSHLSIRIQLRYYRKYAREVDPHNMPQHSTVRKGKDAQIRWQTEVALGNHYEPSQPLVFARE